MKYTTDERADVATPLWVVNTQNNLIDAAWLENELNVTSGKTWKTQKAKLKFRPGRNWQDYVKARRLELACGEAPYLTSRYDALSKLEIPLEDRIGMFDRKLRVLDENVRDDEWQAWALSALSAVFGVEVKVDKVARARENLVKTFVEYYERRFYKMPPEDLLEQVQKIVENNVVMLDVLDDTEDKLFAQKFEAIVGNPPYHSVGGAGGTNDAPIYQEFVWRMLALAPEFLSLVIPARWFAGGRENLLGDFRKTMMEKAGLKDLVVYTKAREVFPWVNLSGGICYFLAAQGYVGKCDYVLHENGEVYCCQRELGSLEVLVREPMLVGIVEKVEKHIREQGLDRVEEIVLGNTPFGISSDLYTRDGQVPLFMSKTMEHDTALYFFEKPRRVRRYIERARVTKNQDLIDCPKVLLPAAGGTGDDCYVLGRPQVMAAPSACSQSYLVAILKTETEAKNFDKYVQTKFFRVLVKASKVSQAAARRVYHFVPLEELGAESEIEWHKSVAEIDWQLYQKYGLSDDEIDYVEKRVAYFE